MNYPWKLTIHDGIRYQKIYLLQNYFYSTIQKVVTREIKKKKTIRLKSKK